jgi:hypothetical protein
VSYFDHQPSRPPTELPPEHVANLRRALAAHANDPTTGACPVCVTKSCLIWRDTYDRLAAAGQLLAADPTQWKSPDEKRR